MESFEQNDNIVDLDNLINDFSRLSDVTFVENGLRPEIFPEYSNRLSALSCYVAEKIRPDLNLQKIDEYALIDGFLKTSNIEGKTDEEPGYDDAFGIVVMKLGM
jgi:hypothetical protein